jgi:hypothetical protein
MGGKVEMTAIHLPQPITGCFNPATGKKEKVERDM